MKCSVAEKGWRSLNTKIYIYIRRAMVCNKEQADKWIYTEHKLVGGRRTTVPNEKKEWKSVWMNCSIFVVTYPTWNFFSVYFGRFLTLVNYSEASTACLCTFILHISSLLLHISIYVCILYTSLPAPPTNPALHFFYIISF